VTGEMAPEPDRTPLASSGRNGRAPGASSRPFAKAHANSYVEGTAAILERKAHGIVGQRAPLPPLTTAP